MANDHKHFHDFEEYAHPWSGTPELRAEDIIAGKYDRHIAKRNLKMAKAISAPLMLDLEKGRRGGGNRAFHRELRAIATRARSGSRAGGRSSGNAAQASPRARLSVSRSRIQNREKVAYFNGRRGGSVPVPRTAGEPEHLRFEQKVADNRSSPHWWAPGHNGSGYTITSYRDNMWIARTHPSHSHAQERDLAGSKRVGSGGTEHNYGNTHRTRAAAVEAVLAHHNRAARRERLRGSTRLSRIAESARRQSGGEVSERRPARSTIVTPRQHQLHSMLVAAHNRGQLAYSHSGDDSAIRAFFPAHADLDFIKNMYGAPAGFGVKLRDISTESGSVYGHDGGDYQGHSMRVDGSIVDANGRRVGTIDREFSKSRRGDKSGVYHAGMFVDDAYTGRGFGHSMMKGGLAAYKAMGIKHVRVSASPCGNECARSRGTLAWASYFDFASESTRRNVVGEFKKWIIDSYGGKGERGRRDMDRFSDPWGYRRDRPGDDQPGLVTTRELNDALHRVHYPWDIAKFSLKGASFPQEVFNHPDIPEHYDRRKPVGRFYEKESDVVGRRFLIGQGGWSGLIDLSDSRSAAVKHLKTKGLL